MSLTEPHQSRAHFLRGSSPKVRRFQAKLTLKATGVHPNDKTNATTKENSFYVN